MGKLGYLCVFLFGGNLWAQSGIADNTAGWVVLPVDQYQALRHKANAAEPGVIPASGPPVEATVSRIDYDLRIENGVASGKARIAIDVLRDGWARMPIPQGILVRAARLNGETAALVSDHKQRLLSVVLQQKGRAVLDLDVAFTVSSAGGEQRLSLPAGNAGVTRVSIQPPSAEVDLRATGGHVAERSAGQWVAYARGADPLVLSWRRRVEEPRAELPLRTQGSLTQLFGLGEDATSLSAEVSIAVLQGVARQVKIAVPANVTINQVPGATVSDWDIDKGELTVNFLEPVERSVSFTIAGESRLPREGEIALPVLKLLGVERDSGGVAVEVLGAGEIIEASPTGLDPVDAAALGGTAAIRQSPSMVAYRYRALGGADAYVAPPVTYTDSGSRAFGGRVLDPAGAVLPGATLQIRATATGATWRAVTNQNGSWAVSNVPAGQYEISVDLTGFKQHTRYLTYSGAGGISFDTVLEVGLTNESITVTAEASLLKTESSTVVSGRPSVDRIDESQVRTSNYAGQFGQAGGSIVNLQQRVAGVLPIAISVPRNGTSYRFLRPLVVSEETRLTFNYKRK